MDLFKFFRFKKKPVEADIQQLTAPPQAEEMKQEAMPAKKAIAILPYNNLNYFKQVFESVLSQTINGKPFTELYDLYVFQDGLQARHQNTLAEYEAIQELCLTNLPDCHFKRQAQNIGTALQFAYVEQHMFEVANNGTGYDFCILLEHDFVLAPGYLQTMESLHQRFAQDERIAAVSVHSSSYKLPQEVQEELKHTYKVMTHDWGAGVFKRTWQKRLPAMQSYYKLLGNLSFEQRNHLLIHDWKNFMGFAKGSTSQDTIKASIDSALNTLRVTPYINQGTYIGVEGMNWNQTIYEAAGYDQTVNFEGEYSQAPELTQNNFEMMLANQRSEFLADATNFDALAFKERLASNQTDFEFARNALSGNTTAEDITAAYKFFLGRFPENNEVVQQRIGLDAQFILRTFMLSQEFLQKQENWPMVIEAAKRIVEMNRIAQSDGQTQTSSKQQATAPATASTPAMPPIEPTPQASTPTP